MMTEGERKAFEEGLILGMTLDLGVVKVIEATPKTTTSGKE